MGDAVQDHPERESGKGQQDEHKVSRLLAGELQRVEAAFLDSVDFFERLREVTGIAGIKEFSTGRGDCLGDLL